jgi:tetratricopeptide (TPR) repeat protein
MLCQAVQILDAAEDVLQNYVSSVRRAPAEIRPLALTRDLRLLASPTGETAEAYGQEAAAAAPNYAEAHYELGLLRFHAGNVAGAARSFERALVATSYLDPVVQAVNKDEESVGARAAYYQGLCYLKHDNRSRALRSLFRALWLHPNYPRAAREIVKLSFEINAQRQSSDLLPTAMASGQNLPTLPALPSDLSRFETTINGWLAQRRGRTGL